MKGERMMILYMWTEKLYGCEVEGDFAFSKKLLVSYDPAEEVLKLSENKAYTPGFFGDRIEDITVLAGENGVGKTTVCRKLLSILTGREKYGGPYVIVFENGAEIDIYCRGRNVRELEFNGEKGLFEDGRYQNENKYEVFRHKAEAGADFPMLPLLVTNGFIGMDLEKEFEAEGNRRYYRSPAYLLRNAGEWAKNDYGAEWDGYLHKNSYAYGTERTKDPVFEYQVYQNKLTVEGFFATEAIPLMKEFAFYKAFNMGVRSFGGNQEMNVSCGPLDHELNRLERMRKGILERCYLMLLKEAYLYCGVGKREENEENPRPNAIGMSIIEHIKNWKNFSLSESIVDDSFNSQLLEKINGQVEESAGNNPNVKSRSADRWGWYTQFKKVITQLKYWKNDPVKKGLFHYPIGRYRFNSSEGKELLEFYRERLEEDEPFWKRTIGFNIESGSTGEIAMVNLFAYIMDLMYSWKNRPEKALFLMIDEIDVNIHPKWQQEIIFCIIKFLEQQFSKHRFQLLITSHSPICLSDIPSERVLRLKRCENIIQVSPCQEPTFGANIYDLFYDGFFMEKGTIGRFAQEKIDGAIRRLCNNNIQNIGSETPYIVKSVGESMVREQMEDMLARVRKEDYKEII